MGQNWRCSIRCLLYFLTGWSFNLCKNHGPPLVCNYFFWRSIPQAHYRWVELVVDISFFMKNGLLEDFTIRCQFRNDTACSGWAAFYKTSLYSPAGLRRDTNFDLSYIPKHLRRFDGMVGHSIVWWLNAKLERQTGASSVADADRKLILTVEFPIIHSGAILSLLTETLEVGCLRGMKYWILGIFAMYFVLLQLHTTSYIGFTYFFFSSNLWHHTKPDAPAVATSFGTSVKDLAFFSSAQYRFMRQGLDFGGSQVKIAPCTH